MCFQSGLKCFDVQHATIYSGCIIIIIVIIITIIIIIIIFWTRYMYSKLSHASFNIVRRERSLFTAGRRIEEK